ncbi:MAG: carboxypeptidase-like regulatory domain-containing protein [Verrucomicrobiales bacterium]|jgi:hypothetical protein|nr:carboxypeptidase-like regulatory domain-containing protein [Verrucomicrobiales bacterium]
MKKRWLVLLMVSGWWPAVLGAEPSVTVSGSAAAPPQARGVGVIELKIGVKQYLANMGLAVVPAAARAEIIRARNDQWRLRASRANYDDGFHNLDLDAIGGTAVRLAALTVKTDAAGRYEIRGLAAGDYLLYAQYRSRYAVAYWLVPLTVQAGAAPLTVDLNNDNLQEVFNLKKTRW